MKKLILLSLICFSSLQFTLAEESQNNKQEAAQDKSAIAKINPEESSTSTADIDDPKDEASYKLYPKNHKSFYISTEQQVKLMNTVLKKQGIDEVIRYFLSLKAHNNQKAIDLLSHKSDLDLSLKILENLPISVFSEILTFFFQDIGGEAIPHCSYKEPVTLNYNSPFKTADPKIDYITPPARAQQYINFFMVHNHETKEGYGLVYASNPTLLKARGKRIAKVLNTFEEKSVIELLYGRSDTVFLPQNRRIVKDHYEKKEKRYYDDSTFWDKQETTTLKRETKTSCVDPQLIDYIIPHLSPNLIVAILAKETEKNLNRLPDLVKSLGCSKTLNELFEYLEDSIKSKVFQVCENDDSLLDILDLDKEDNLLLGDKKDL